MGGRGKTEKGKTAESAKNTKRETDFARRKEGGMTQKNTEHSTWNIEPPKKKGVTRESARASRKKDKLELYGQEDCKKID
jgi:hypothetical protein